MRELKRIDESFAHPRWNEIPIYVPPRFPIHLVIFGVIMGLLIALFYNLLIDWLQGVPLFTTILKQHFRLVGFGRWLSPFLVVAGFYCLALSCHSSNKKMARRKKNRTTMYRNRR